MNSPEPVAPGAAIPYVPLQLPPPAPTPTPALAGEFDSQVMRALGGEVYTARRRRVSEDSVGEYINKPVASE